MPHSTPAGSLDINVNHMTVKKTHQLLLLTISPSNSLGGNLAGTVQEAVVEAEVQILVFPSHGSSKVINDNYCVGPTQVDLSGNQFYPVENQKQV